jgi:hypothetical protein
MMHLKTVLFYFSGVHPVALYYHSLQDTPAITTKNYSCYFISHNMFQVEYNTLERHLMLYST